MRVAGHVLAALGALVSAPVAAVALLARPSWRAGLSERLGLLPRCEPGSIWIHGAGLGELRAASSLVDRLLERGHAVYTSTTGVRARAVLRGERPDVPCHFAPVDHPWCVDAAIARVAPAVLVLVETELWPSWIGAAHRRGIPVLLVSGRLSDRSLPRYRLLRSVLAPALGRLRAVGARTQLDAERFEALGVPRDRISVTGDLKLDVEQDPPPLAPELERLMGEVPLIVAGSTHPGEERAMLDALDALEAAGISAALALAPRRPERAPDLVRMLRQRNRPWRRRTRVGEKPLAPGEVLVMDSIGELSALYARAVAAFVGGTLVPVGGHNLLEPVAAGRPVIFGPHTENVRHAVEILTDSGAGHCVRDAQELASTLGSWLSVPEATRARGRAGLAALREHRGSAERSERLVQAALCPPVA